MSLRYSNILQDLYLWAVFERNNLQELTIEMFQDTQANSDEEDTVRFIKAPKKDMDSPLNQDIPDVVTDPVYESQVSKL